MKRILLSAALFAALIPAVQAQHSVSERAPVVTSDFDYRSGMRDRQIWENWFGSLPYGGSFFFGAAHYAAHRSTQTIDCVAAADGDVNFRDGCTHAMQFLAPVDVKRHTNRQYLYGWNRVRPTSTEALNEALRALQDQN